MEKFYVKKNIIIDKIGLNNEQKQLVIKIHSLFHLDDIGLASYFDCKNSIDYNLAGEPLALYQNIDLLRRIESKTIFLNEVNNNKNIKHLIWMSKKSSIGEIIDFCMSYAHEMEHLQQSMTNPYIPIISDFIVNAWIELGSYNNIHSFLRPDELHCEKKAFQIAKMLLGEKQLLGYYEHKYNNIKKQYFEKYSEIYKEDVESELKKLLLVNYGKLKLIQNKLSIMHEFEFDIDKFLQTL